MIETLLELVIELFEVLSFSQTLFEFMENIINYGFVNTRNEQKFNSKPLSCIKKSRALKDVQKI